jgi:hypothetical protein
MIFCSLLRKRYCGDAAQFISAPHYLTKISLWMEELPARKPLSQLPRKRMAYGFDAAAAGLALGRL